MGFSGESGNLRKLLHLGQDPLRPLRYKLEGVSEKMRRFIDAQLLIAAQTTSVNANALYSAAALDLSRQGVIHPEGGMGGICNQMVEKLREKKSKSSIQKRNQQTYLGRETLSWG